MAGFSGTRSFSAPRPTDLYAAGGMAVPTPVTDGKLLYTLFGTGELVCLDFAGKPVWIRSLAEEYGPFRNRWGMGTSPILIGDLLVVQVDHWSQSYLLGVETSNGANRWKTKRDATVNWTSPLAVKVKERTEIVTFGTYQAISYDAVSGQELWSVKGMHMQCIPSPVVEGNMLFACSGDNTMGIRLDGSTGRFDQEPRPLDQYQGPSFLAFAARVPGVSSTFPPTRALAPVCEARTVSRSGRNGSTGSSTLRRWRATARFTSRAAKAWCA